VLQGRERRKKDGFKVSIDEFLFLEIARACEILSRD